jgi:hypothetical protein
LLAQGLALELAHPEPPKPWNGFSPEADPAFLNTLISYQQDSNNFKAKFAKSI